MSTLAALPIILVSAKSEAIASHIISEIIGSEPVEAASTGARVWRIANKYYEADVRLQPRADGADPLPADAAACVDGHVIYLAEDECSAEIAERRRYGCARVCVVACAAGCVPGALLAWAARRRHEPVLLHQGEGEEEQEEEVRGWEGVRAALHAHVWRSARVAHTPLHYPLEYGSGSESSEGDGGDGGDGEEDGEMGVERAEQWAAALGAVEGVRALRGEERRAAAEALVAAFAQALGHDVSTL